MQQASRRQQSWKNLPHSSAIQPIWYGQRVAVIGGGPSLTETDVKKLNGKCKVIAVNDAYKLASWANVLYSCDLKWWDWHIDALSGFYGMRYTQSLDAAQKYGIKYIEGRPGSGLSTDAHYIHTNKNSGAQAINLAYLFGASEIILLGFDMQLGNDGQSHWFGDHPDKVRPNYADFQRDFEVIATQHAVDIINCSRETALSCFPRKSLNSIL